MNKLPAAETKVVAEKSLTRFGVYYSRNLSETIGFKALHDDKPVTLDRDAFTKNYVYVGSVMAESEEDVFRLMNDYATNPLSAENGGQDTARKVGHTSMSVGDVVVPFDTRKKRVVAGLGFLDLNLEVR